MDETFFCSGNSKSGRKSPTHCRLTNFSYSADAMVVPPTAPREVMVPIVSDVDSLMACPSNKSGRTSPSTRTCGFADFTYGLRDLPPQKVAANAVNECGGLTVNVDGTCVNSDENELRDALALLMDYCKDHNDASICQNMTEATIKEVQTKIPECMASFKSEACANKLVTFMS